ncbi:hypothetical protein CDAR_47941 [Caerostris darwini]|uniref:Uncharacterized protein n=1 Tax=Caerostris darwini TaxID=1538125 RepID=A0AAV4VPW3_9ARAC|nr:hypothetical protein CDAR_47941 [Caerostris darwini]
MTCRKKELEPGTTGGVIGTNQDVNVKERGNGFCNVWSYVNRDRPSSKLGLKKELYPGTTGGVIGTNQDVDVKERGNGFCNDGEGTGTTGGVIGTNQDVDVKERGNGFCNVWGSRELRSAIIKARIVTFGA